MAEEILAKFTSLHEDTCSDFKMTKDKMLVGRRKH